MFSTLLAASLKSVPVLAAAWMITFAMRRRSAAARHLVWTGAAIGLLALPFLSESLPRLPLPAARVFDAATFDISVSARQTAPFSSSAGQSAPAPGRRFDWRELVSLAWAVVAALSLLRMAIGYLAIWRMRRRALRFEDRTLISGLARSLGIEREVEVYLTEPGSMPLTAGLLRSAVFLAEDSSEWSEDRLRLVLLHELAHVRRGDPALHLIGRIALILYWWNPLAWIAWRAFLKERERAADDLVLNAGARASEYATHLLEIARGMRIAALTGSAAIAMARRSQLEGRLMSILDSKIDRRNPRIGVWIAAALAVGMVAPIAALRAQQPAASGPAFRGSARQEIAKSGSRESSAAERLIKLGQGQLIAKNFDKAIEYFEQARLADPQQSGLALLWEAIANDRANLPEAAESLFKSALAQQDPRSMDYARTERIYAQFLRSHQRGDETTALDASADEIQKANGQSVAPMDNVYHIGGDVSQPKIIRKVEPQYSEEARMAKLQGQVQLSVVIQPDGTAQNAIVTRPLGMGLDEQAVAAVSQWRFSPGMKDGEPVPVYATIEVNFRLL